MVDTGALKSVCSAVVASVLGLKPSGRFVRLTGIGATSAWLAQPVCISWNGRSCMTEICVVEEEGIPSLLGLEELRALGVVIRPADMTILTCPCEATPAKKVDIASGIDSSLTDAELLVQKLEELRVRLGEDLSDCQKKEVLSLFEKHSACWLKPKSGQIRTPARFEVIGRPYKEKLRPLSPALRKELQDQIESMLKAGVIRPCRSPWGSVPVFVKKKDGGWRMAVDYRGVNRQLKSDCYPIPNAWDNIQQASGHRFYTCLDGMWGFWNVPLEESSREVTAVLTPMGSFEYNVLPFGVKNSPSEFQRAMDVLFSDLYGHGVFCYIDDIVIYADTWEEHLRLVQEVLRRCVEGGLFLKVSKSFIGCREVPLLGHLISEDGISPQPSKVSAVRTARRPTSKEEVRSFLGTVGYLRRFIPSFSDLTVPLSDLCKKNEPFIWTHECDKCFRELKDLLAEVVLLSTPQGEGPFVLVCDASDVALGGVLCQLQGEDLVILEFASRKFSSAESVWPTYEREAYAIRWAVEHFANYLDGMKFFVFTDHASLQWLDRSSAGKVRRWALYLQQFDMEIRSIPGNCNLVADWLSRSVGDASDDECDQICVPSYPVRMDLRKLSAPYIPTRAEFELHQASVPEEDRQWLFVGPDKLLYNIRTSRLYVPQPLRESILYWFHASRFGAHMGCNRMYRRMLKWVWWPKMRLDISSYIRACLPCQRKDAPRTHYLRDVLSRPFPCQLVSLDHVGPREWCGQACYYLVIIDHATRFMVCRRVQSTAADEVVTLFKEHWMPIFGAPECILTDRGSAFMSAKFRAYILQELNSSLIYTSVNYPQGNALNEASHKGIEAALRTRAQYDQASNFNEALADAVLAYNCTPHSALGESPGFLMLGFDVALPGWQRYQRSAPTDIRLAKVQDLRNRMAMKAIIQSNDGVRLTAANEFKIGDWVVYHLSGYERKQQAGEEGLVKYTAEWSEPVRITELNQGAAMVASSDGGKNRQVPLRALRKLLAEEEVPPSLRGINAQSLKIDKARYSLPPAWVGSPKRVRLQEDARAVSKDSTSETKRVSGGVVPLPEEKL